MNCCRCAEIETTFNRQVAARDLRRYRAKGPRTTTRLLLDAIAAQDVSGKSLLDIGGGVGAIQHELARAGVTAVTSVEASAAYLAAAREEAECLGYARKVAEHAGDFVALAAGIPDADIVTLDRVVCCYPDMDTLVATSAARARERYGLVYPRDSWWIKVANALQNLLLRPSRTSFRTRIHPARAIDAVVRGAGLMRCFSRQTLIWEVVVYERPSAGTGITAPGASIKGVYGREPPSWKKPTCHGLRPISTAGETDSRSGLDRLSLIEWQLT